ncbi:metallophosphoesterase [Allorhizobium taibaishanense]|uniref:3',5'-cyclic AMP phosphodiesterase CpdA n=1 Tax=Allorhizobium taibaishanense TaxID=887144 RepID=A0A7W6HSG4_9HYPH|nr:metallophosphoesterase family protein [Allorhizobium taibaishanense]MBB4010333.1 3',5'-cyclic AMP phosphodiesterase CpdA [Allorhizobium taibaishanense]
MRIFVGSDFHADHRENMDWLRQISSEDYRQDILVVAGDVANGLALFETVMALFANRFSKVLYVPGNHDLWVDEKGQGTSFDKFSRIQEVCTALGSACSL